MFVRELTRKETWSVQQAWRSVFARRLYRLTGRWTRGIDREVFHPKYVVKYLTGANAEAEYALAEAQSLYIVDENGETCDLHDEKPALADFIEKRGVLIFPENYAWTVVTGPDYGDRVCFTYRDWVDDVDPFDEGPAP